MGFTCMAPMHGHAQLMYYRLSVWPGTEKARGVVGTIVTPAYCSSSTNT